MVRICMLLDAPSSSMARACPPWWAFSEETWGREATLQPAADGGQDSQCLGR